MQKNNPGSRAEKPELPKATPHIIMEIVEYVPNSVITKTIIKKSTGDITVSSLNAGEGLIANTIPFDSFIQIIDGTAEVTINKHPYRLNTGEGIVIPAHCEHHFHAIEQFKMISTIIKSGYE